MNLEVIKKINIDFHDARYISVNAKQYDRESRFILVTCYNNGIIFPLDKTLNGAYVRYRKVDDLGVFNSCEITDEGKILVELTEQMLSKVGKCLADLVVVNIDNPVEIIEETGEIVMPDNNVVSTMIFCVNVIESAFDNTEIESSHEYNALNELLIKANADYTNVINTVKDYASNAKTSEENAALSETNTKISEENAKESEQNALQYMNGAEVFSINAKTSEDNAKTSEVNAYASETKAKEYESNAELSESNAKISENNAKISEENASSSEINAKESEANAALYAENASTSENNAKASENEAKNSEGLALQYSLNAEESAIEAKTSEENTKTSETNAKTSEANAKEYETNASASASNAYASEKNAEEYAEIVSNKVEESENNVLLSKSYAVGETGIRIDEDIDNSKYYYLQAKTINDSINGSIVPMGTISFVELGTVAKDTGYMYIVSDDFVTDETFKKGAGVSYAAGTAVYYTADGYWDCFATKTLVVTDDDDGNVTIHYSSDSITTDEEYDILTQTITELQERIKALEEQTVLGIN